MINKSKFKKLLENLLLKYNKKITYKMNDLSLVPISKKYFFFKPLKLKIIVFE